MNFVIGTITMASTPEGEIGTPGVATGSVIAAGGTALTGSVVDSSVGGSALAGTVLDNTVGDPPETGEEL